MLCNLFFWITHLKCHCPILFTSQCTVDRQIVFGALLKCNTYSASHDNYEHAHIMDELFHCTYTPQVYKYMMEK